MTVWDRIHNLRHQTGTTVRHQTQGLDEALQFNRTFDRLMDCRTTYHRLTLPEISSYVWSEPPAIRIHNRITNLIARVGLSTGGTITLNQETLRDRTDIHQKSLFNLCSMRLMSTTGTFYSPICMLRVNGTTSVHPGQTRLLYQRTHPEQIDVMLTSFDDYTVAGSVPWVLAFETPCDFVVRRFDQQRQHRTGHYDGSMVYKEIVTDPSNTYRSEHHEDTPTVVVTDTTVTVDDICVARIVGGLWTIQ